MLNPAIRELARRGADTAVVTFSGGNDEGGPGTITLLKNGEKIAQIDPYSVEAAAPERWDAEKNEWVPTNVPSPEAKSEWEFVEALVAPIYSRWGGFGGDFYVSGKLTWDVATGKGELDYTEWVPQSEHHTDYV